MPVMKWVENVDPADHTGSVKLRGGSYIFYRGTVGDLTVSEINDLRHRLVLVPSELVPPEVVYYDSPTFIQDTAPDHLGPYAWWDTSGGNLTLWIEDGT